MLGCLRKTKQHFQIRRTCALNMFSFNEYLLPVVMYGFTTITLTKNLPNKLKVTQRKMEWSVIIDQDKKRLNLPENTI